MNPMELFTVAHQPVFVMRDFIEMANRTGIKMYLTGSHYFGGHRPTSDWDFFCEVVPTKWLKEQGFYKDTDAVYTDTLTKAVWSGVFGGVDVHVQIVKDAAINLKAQLALKSTGALKLAHKCTNQQQAEKILWDLAIEAAQNA